MTDAVTALSRLFEAMVADLPQQVEREAGLTRVRLRSVGGSGVEASGYMPDGREVIVTDTAYLDAAVRLIEASRRLA